MKLVMASLLLCMVANGVSQAAGPPKCRPGSAPVLDISGWTCIEGRYWPTVENQNRATAPLKLDCALGTSRIRIGPIEFEDSACLPPKPRCARGSQADPNPALPQGWNCLFPPDCPRGTRAELTPGQGYNCLPLESSPGCPPHTASGNYGAGVPGGCFPSDQKTCAQLHGWEWNEPSPDTAPNSPSCWPPASSREAL
jgi:hypothetical protein